LKKRAITPVCLKTMRDSLMGEACSRKDEARL
jgi:hypothetical protein